MEGMMDFQSGGELKPNNTRVNDSFNDVWTNVPGSQLA